MQTVPTFPDGLAFASFLTTVGIPIAAALITAVVALLKAVVPTVIERLTGAAVAFILSIVLYVLTGIAVGVDSLDDFLVVFAAWITCATAAVGIHQVTARAALTRHQTF